MHSTLNLRGTITTAGLIIASSLIAIAGDKEKAHHGPEEHEGLDHHDDREHEHGNGEEAELATHMAELSILTHKLGLAIDAKNPQMTQFYTVESYVKAQEIVKLVPEYQGLHIDELLPSMLYDGYFDITRNIRKKPADFEKLKTAYNGLIARCNACHEATKFGYLKVKHNTLNPYLLDFTYRGGNSN